MYRRGILGYYISIVLRLIIESRHIILILFSTVAIIIALKSYYMSEEALENTRQINVSIEAGLDVNHPVRMTKRVGIDGLEMGLEIKVKNLSNQKITIDRLEYIWNKVPDMRPKIDKGVNYAPFTPIILEPQEDRSYTILAFCSFQNKAELFQNIKEIFDMNPGISALDLLTQMRSKSLSLTGEILAGGKYKDSNPINLELHIKENNAKFEKTISIH